MSDPTAAAATPAQLQDLHATVAQLSARIVGLEIRQPPQARRRLPDPDKFNGQLRYDTWRPLARAVLRIDGDAIGNNEAQLFWLYGNLDSKIQAMVLPQLSLAEETEEWDVEAVFDQLDRVFGNPSKQEDAITDLHSIQQGSDSVAVYLSRFERLLFEAKAMALSDANKIAILKNGANRSIKSKLEMQLSLPATYNGFVEALYRLGSSCTNPAPYHTQTAQTSHQSRRLTAPAGDPMDLTRLRQLSKVEDTEEEPARLRTLGTTFRTTFAPSSTPSQRREWQRAGLCKRCGTAGHQLKDCPLEPANQNLEISSSSSSALDSQNNTPSSSSALDSQNNTPSSSSALDSQNDTPFMSSGYQVPWHRDYGYGYEDKALHKITFM